MKAIFLTGQSNRRSCQLSPTQQRLANLLREEGITVAPLNFPYDTQMDTYRETDLLSASISNALQYLYSRRPAFTQKYRTQVIRQIDEKGHYIVLAGSCGLELLHNLQLPDKVLKKLHVIAYGPVARALPRTQITIIQGRSDWLSKCFFKKVDYLVECGHMDYLKCDEVIALLLKKTRSIKSKQYNETKTN